jgi:hypothetical protein
VHYTLHFDPATCFLTVHVDGDWSWVDAISAGRVLREVASTGRAKGVLIDLRDVLGLNLRTLSMYELASRLVAGRHQHEHAAARGAFLVPSLGPESDVKYQYFEDTSRNRGLPYQVFKELDPAMQWLRGE